MPKYSRRSLKRLKNGDVHSIPVEYYGMKTVRHFTYKKLCFCFVVWLFLNQL